MGEWVLLILLSVCVFFSRYFCVTACLRLLSCFFILFYFHLLRHHELDDALLSACLAMTINVVILSDSKRYVQFSSVDNALIPFIPFLSLSLTLRLPPQLYPIQRTTACGVSVKLAYTCVFDFLRLLVGKQLAIRFYRYIASQIKTIRMFHHWPCK